MTLGKKLKLRRIEHDLTCKQLAEQMDVTPQYISDIERGVKNPSIKLLRKIARLYNISVFEFIEE